MDRRWIKLWRRIEDSSFWKKKPFDLAHAWIDLLLMANHKDNETIMDCKKVKIERGSFITSDTKLAKKWGWSRGKVRRFLFTLCTGSEPELHQNRTGKWTYLTIRNYGIYQEGRTGKRTGNGQVTDRRRTGDGHKQELKNVRMKELNKIVVTDEVAYLNSHDKFNSIKKPEELIRAIKVALPWVNVLQELKNMSGWLVANPKRVKKDYRRFIWNWVNKIEKPDGFEDKPPEVKRTFLQKHLEKEKKE